MLSLIWCRAGALTPLSYPDTYIIFIGKVRHTRKIGYRKHSSYEIIEDSRTYCPSVKKGLELA